MKIELSDEDKSDIAKMVLVHYQTQNMSNVLFETVYNGMKERAKTMIENVVNEKFARLDAWDEFIEESLKDVTEQKLKEYISGEVHSILNVKSIDQLIESDIVHVYKEKMRKLREFLDDDDM
jgi:hypothetical protein